MGEICILAHRRGISEILPCYMSQIIFITFYKFNLVIFQAFSIRFSIPNSSYSFMPILVKLYRCFGHGSWDIIIRLLVLLVC